MCRLIPIAITGATRFYETFVDILGKSSPCPLLAHTTPLTAPPHTALIGYWLAPFCAILLTEHVLFRRRSFAAYDVAGAWDTPSHPDLASPWPGLATVAVTVALVTLCMQQAWWTGPVAARGTGDVGMLVSFVACVGVYAAARALELRWRAARGAPGRERGGGERRGKRVG